MEDKIDMDKSFKNAKWFAVGLLVLILFILSIIGGVYISISLVVYVGLIITLIGTIWRCSSQTMLGPVCGIIVCALLILFGGLIEKIFGILYLIDCIKLIKGLNS